MAVPGFSGSNGGSAGKKGIIRITKKELTKVRPALLKKLAASKD
jgi:hypothetical protein